MKLLILLNPISGGNDKSDFLGRARALCDRYGLDYRVQETTGEDDAQRLRDACAEFEPDRLAVVGGDGTVQLAVSALREQNLPIGIVPFGSANGMAAELGVAQDPLEAFRDLITTQHQLPLDLIQVNDEHLCLHMGDVGINANMVQAFEEDEGRGWWTYAKHFVSALQQAEAFGFSLESAGKKLESHAYMLAIANARKYGTGMVLNPEGSPHDGMFELVVVKKNDLSGLLQLGLSSLMEKGWEQLDEYMDVHSLGQGHIQLEQPMVLQLDGEVIGEVETLHLKALPAAATFLATTDNPFLGD